ncbi:hypothetical protein [Paraburkholderia adhaesiva]|uniref:hypothetical protein n=1 Tax=Paraburkholderia adhaesiva TaxID=2883244 RepID=UPI001F32146A|nr:hypothetical protein [Paraburkholderia adhaesiva]
MNTPTKDTPTSQATADSGNTPGNTQTVTVARGRSIRIGSRTYRAGESAAVPSADVARLRALGFIARDRDAQTASEEEKARTQGPTFETRSGPAVKQRR